MIAEDIPDDADGDALRLMRSQGDSLQAPRDLDFSVIFPDEAGAAVFCQIVASIELRTRYEKSDVEDDFSWDVTVTKHMVPLHSAIVFLENRLGVIAAPYRGKVDGWGCFNVRDIPPVGDRGDG